MASTNQSPQYLEAEGKYLNAITDDEKISCLQEMIKLAPHHKSSEKMLAGLKTRLKKLREKKEKSKKLGKGKQGIKKQGLQACLIGLTNSGKSFILSKLTNATPEISPYLYTTKQANLGTLDIEGVKIQIIDLPAVESEFFDSSLANTTDLLLIIITSIQQIEQISSFLQNATANRLIIFNNINNQDIRKLEATLKSKKLNFFLFSNTKENIQDLKEKIFSQFKIIRIYTKQPHKPATPEPIIMSIGSTVEQVAAKISKQLLATIKETRITGPSSKFPNQKVGLKHVLKDKDIVEFHTR